MSKAASVLLLFTVAANGAGVGDQLMRTYTKYVKFPMTVKEAVEAGWETLGECDPRYGIPYAKGDGLGRHNPTALYFTRAGGLVSGITVDQYGAAPPKKVIDMGYFEKVGDVHRIGVSFRENPCAVEGAVNVSYPIGDRVVVSPSGANLSIPLTRADAVARNWHAGSCFYGMGTHYFYDLATAPEMSWKAENLLPVVPMYNNNDEIQGVFFASWTIQQEIFNANTWEPIPLHNYLMCKNTCDSDCTFSGTWFWSTYHVYFKDLDLATCHNDCRTACCH